MKRSSPRSRESLLAAAKMLLLLPAATPLVVDGAVLYPFVDGKALWFRTIVAVVAGVVFALVLVSAEIRSAIQARFAAGIRSPIAIALAAYLVMSAVSTVTAVNPNRAFFGDVERSEGFVALAALATFYLLAAALFDRGWWRRFFWLTLLTAAVLFVHALLQRVGGDPRPGSFTGHPAFLGPYALFVIASAILLAGGARRAEVKWLALAGIPLGIATILLTETRAAMLGLAIGLLAVLALLAVRGPRRRPAAILLGCVVIGAVAFVVTRQSPLWQRIPGVSRLAAWNTAADNSTRWRLGAWQAGIAAMNPARSGWGRVLVGWGPENLHVPFNENYDPPAELYDPGWYDRAHNTLLDAALTVGVMGLLAYLALCGSFAVSAVNASRPPYEQVALLFVATSYFAQNMVSFPSLTTAVPFFALLAMASMPFADNTVSHSERRGAAPVIVFGAVAVWSVSLLLWQTIPGYAQMRRYVWLQGASLDPTSLTAEWRRIDAQPTYAREAIRADFLPKTRALLRADLRALPVMEAAMASMRDQLQRDSTNPRHLLSLAQALGDQAELSGDPELHRSERRSLHRALELAPGRQSIRNAVTINESRLNCADDRFLCYYRLLSDMLAARNSEGAGQARERLELIDPARREWLAEVGRRLEMEQLETIHVSVEGANVRILLGPLVP